MGKTTSKPYPDPDIALSKGTSDLDIARSPGGNCVVSHDLRAIATPTIHQQSA